MSDHPAAPPTRAEPPGEPLRGAARRAAGARCSAVAELGGENGAGRSTPDHARAAQAGRVRRLLDERRAAARTAAGRATRARSPSVSARRSRSGSARTRALRRRRPGLRQPVPVRSLAAGGRWRQRSSPGPASAPAAPPAGADPRRVRLRQPDRPDARRPCAQRRLRRCARAHARLPRPQRRARVLRQRRRQRRSASSASRSRRSRAGSRCPRTATTATTSASCRRAAGRRRR